MRRRIRGGGLSEFAFLRDLLPTLPQSGRVRVGPGDDCAVVRGDRSLLLTTDALVEGVHFQRTWLSARQIGAKAILVNLSDIAAMGGTPRFALLSVGVPADLGRAELSQLHRGAAAAARRAGVSIVGGNLSSSDRLFVSVALIGAGDRPLLRRGARAGDAVFVTGTLGDAAAAVDWLRTAGQPPSGRDAAGRDLRFLVRRFAAPTPRLAVGRRLAQARLASAMVDVSDGVVQDLGHLCERSGVGALLDLERLPRSPAYRRLLGDDLDAAARGGEDYELLFTVPRARLARLVALDLGCRVTRVGEVVARPAGVRVRDADGRVRRPGRGGFEHFRPVS